MVQVPAVPFTRCVTSEKSANFSVQVKNKANSASLMWPIMKLTGPCKDHMRE